MVFTWHCLRRRKMSKIHMVILSGCVYMHEIIQLMLLSSAEGAIAKHRMAAAFGCLASLGVFPAAEVGAREPRCHVCRDRLLGEVDR